MIVWAMLALFSFSNTLRRSPVIDFSMPLSHDGAANDLDILLVLETE
jgi:hypothetical protein